MGFSLFIREGHGAGETLRFDEPEVTFGRVTDNDVVLYDPDVSRKHFSIVLEGGCHVLKDLGSSNGTQLNGDSVDAYPLSAGDEIRVGQMVFEFRPEEQAQRNLPARRPRARAQAPAPAAERGGAPAKRAGPGAAGASGALAKKGAAGRRGALAAGGGTARERFQRRREASTLGGRMKLWYQGLEPPRRRLVKIGGAVGGLLVVLGAIAAFSGDEPLVGPRDLSGNVIRFESRMSEWVFGYGVDELTHPARSDLGFAFPYRDGRVTVTFDAGFVEGENEVEIRLNEQRMVGYAPLSIGSWVRDVQFVLPFDALLPNSMNTLVFDQSRNPGARPPAKWAIRGLRIDEHPLPAPDPQLAEQRFALAERRWTHRAVGPRNLYDACRYYREARDYLELMEIKPPLYDEVEARIRECTRELDQIYRQLIFKAQREEQFRNWEAARATLLKILEYFPDETDPRNMTIQNWLRVYR